MRARLCCFFFALKVMTVSSRGVVSRHLFCPFPSFWRLLFIVLRARPSAQTHSTNPSSVLASILLLSCFVFLCSCSGVRTQHGAMLKGGATVVSVRHPVRAPLLGNPPANDDVVCFDAEHTPYTSAAVLDYTRQASSGFAFTSACFVPVRDTLGAALKEAVDRFFLTHLEATRVVVAVSVARVFLPANASMENQPEQAALVRAMISEAVQRGVNRFLPSVLETHPVGGRRVGAGAMVRFLSTNHSDVVGVDFELSLGDPTASGHCCVRSAL